MDVSKPHHGIIDNWQKKLVADIPGLGFVIAGDSIGHPSFHGESISTGPVIEQEGDEIETISDRFTLGTPA